MRDLLRHRDFRLLFIGQTLSMFGDMAMLLVLAMWAKELTGSNAIAGSVFAVLGLPTLLAPLGGVLIDRFRRRTVMIVIDIATAAVVLLPAVRRRPRGPLADLPRRRSSTARRWSSSPAPGPRCCTRCCPRSSSARPTARSAPSARLSGWWRRSPAPALYAGFGGPAVALLDAATFLVSAAALLALRIDEPHTDPVRAALHRRGQRRWPAPARPPVLRAAVVASVSACWRSASASRSSSPSSTRASAKPVEFLGVLGADPGRRRDPRGRDDHRADPAHRRAEAGRLVVRPARRRRPARHVVDAAGGGRRHRCSSAPGCRC